MNHQKRLGQFFTPPTIARAIAEMVRPYLPPNPLVVDLSCGEGILLSTVLEHGLTSPGLVWGVDIDPRMKHIWEEDESLKGCHLLVQDGLTFELSQIAPHLPGVDLGIGNPPYNRAQNLISDPGILRNFQLGRKPLTPAEEALLPVSQLGFDFENPSAPMYIRVFDRVETVVSQPIEALFLEKFIQITRSGGLIILILPEGLFSNEGSQDVRDFIAAQTDVLAIIGLPRRVFNNDAKTDILLLRKKDEPNLLQEHHVFLATISEALRRGNGDELTEAIKIFHIGYLYSGDSRNERTGWNELYRAKRVFYVAHSDSAWQANPPEKWKENNYKRWVGGDTPPQPDDPLMIYRFPAGAEGAGFCRVNRIVSWELADHGQGGYFVISVPWLRIDPPLTYKQIGQNSVTKQWNAYRVRFRGWAKGGRVPDNVWEALLTDLLMQTNMIGSELSLVEE